MAKTKEEIKAERELAVFQEFCSASGLNVDLTTTCNHRPPKPDIACTLDGAAVEFELVEITDEGVARGLAQSLRGVEGVGTPFSQAEPFLYAFTSKQEKTYESFAPLHLLAYYDKQYPWSYADPQFIKDTVGEVAERMIFSGVWSRIWVYDTWERNVLWVYP